MNDVAVRRRLVAIGGASLVTATVLFAAVFTYLAMTFDYPDVLDRPAGDVLPALLVLGGTGRGVWVLYGLIPLLLVPTARGVREAGRITAPHLVRPVVWLAAVSAVAMMAGLLRWPTLQWSLAQDWVSAPAAAREVLATRFDAANLYLGNVIGEFLGELFLNAFFVVSALALSAGRPRRLWLAIAGVAAGILGWMAMFRNITTLVAPVAALNNLVLPVWMLVLGVALAATRVDRINQPKVAHVLPSDDQGGADPPDRAVPL
jgi:hypothetical protein